MNTATEANAVLNNGRTLISVIRLTIASVIRIISTYERFSFGSVDRGISAFLTLEFEVDFFTLSAPTKFCWLLSACFDRLFSELFSADSGAVDKCIFHRLTDIVRGKLETYALKKNGN